MESLRVGDGNLDLHRTNQHTQFRPVHTRKQGHMMAWLVTKATVLSAKTTTNEFLCSILFCGLIQIPPLVPRAAHQHFTNSNSTTQQQCKEYAAKRKERKEKKKRTPFFFFFFTHLDTGVDINGGNLSDLLRRAVEIDESLVNLHFESVEGVGALAAR